MVHGTIGTARDDMVLDPEEDDWDFDQGTLLPLRQEPLYHLKTLELPTVGCYRDNYRTQLLSSILDVLPSRS